MGGGSAELTIDSISMFETLASLRSRLGESELKLGAANRLFREGNYSTAMGMYLLLHNKHPLKLYIDNALMSVHKLGMKHVSSVEELLRLVN